MILRRVIKHFRRIASRSEKLAENYMAMKKTGINARLARILCVYGLVVRNPKRQCPHHLTYFRQGSIKCHHNTAARQGTLCL